MASPRAAACARVGLPCTVYMGEVDMERQAPNVGRMRLMGATVVPVTSGDRTLRAAIDEALRDWVADPDDTFYCLGSAVGAHPYPYLVRELQAIIGREARAQMQEQAGGLPDAVIACVGGGSNAIGLFHAFLGDRQRRDHRRRGRRRRRRARRQRRDAGRGRPGVLHGTYSMLLQDADGQIQETHSVSAGLDYPGVGPEHALLRAIGPRALRIGARRGGAGGGEGVLRIRRHPAGARERACAGGRATLGAAQSGQARAGRPFRPRRQGHADAVADAARAPGGRQMSDVAARAHRRRAAQCVAAARAPALVAFLTAGYPQREQFREHLAAVAAGADVVEIGVPFTDPMADGVTIQRSSHEALAQGVTLHWILENSPRCRR